MAKKKKGKHSFWKRIRFNYRVSIINENTLQEIWKIRASIFSGAILFITIASLLVTFTAFFIIVTPIRYYLPGYLDSEVRETALRSNIVADSLERRMNSYDIYASNVRMILDGTMKADSVKTVTDSLNLSADDPALQKSDVEQDFVQQYGENEKYNLSVLPSANTSSEAFIFFAPLSGAIIEKFNPKIDHYGIALQANAGKTISAVMEGTIIYEGYELNVGNIIQIQHKNGFLSIYKHCGMLQKKIGDSVKTGEAIATFGTKDDKSDKLYFELWYNGVAVNPETYITF